MSNGVSGLFPFNTSMILQISKRVFLTIGTTAIIAVAVLALASCGYRSPLLNAILSNEIVFYGQVLDLEGNPVANAKISYSSLNSGNFDDVWTGGGPPNKIMYTDEKGCFEIHEIGGSLFVACEHQDYYGTHDHAEKSQRKFGYGFQVGDDPAWDPQNPAIFRLRKKGIREPLYYSCGKVIAKGKRWIQIPEEPYAINLANGEAEESPTSLYISYKTDRQEGERRGFSWEYTLRIPDGGFIERNDDFDFIAPEGGYKEEIKVGYLRESEDWNNWKKGFYFVRFSNGLYGFFEIHTDAFGWIMFQSLINPNPASRNLEYEYEKQINKNQRSGSYRGQL